MSVKLKRLSAGWLMAILLVVALLPTKAAAAGKIVLDRAVSLNIVYKENTTAISDAHFSLYKVADVDEYASMTLTSDFEAYKGTVSGLNNLDTLTQDQWQTLASTLQGYVQRDALHCVCDGKTDSQGILPFSDLEAGLYLVIGDRLVTSDRYMYTAMPSLLFLPGGDRESNSWNYNVTAFPKYTKVLDDEDYVKRKVIKVWDDAGYETIRPKRVKVQLLKDGVVADTQVLNKKNNWSYTWDDLDAGCEWEVVEKATDGYEVSITRNGTVITLTNKYVVPFTGNNIPIQKRITGDTPSTNSTFTFVLSAKDASNPMPAGSDGTRKEITITGAGSNEFGEIPFKKPGTYIYTISEKNGNVEGYTYDSRVYTVTFEVIEKNGELISTRTMKDNEGNDYSLVEFTNKFGPPPVHIPQTGVLWWPVPVLLSAGLIFIMIGVVRRRKYN